MHSSILNIYITITIPFILCKAYCLGCSIGMANNICFFAIIISLTYCDYFACSTYCATCTLSTLGSRMASISCRALRACYSTAPLSTQSARMSIRTFQALTTLVSTATLSTLSARMSVVSCRTV